MSNYCNICPNKCGVLRTQDSLGRCKATNDIKIAKYYLHPFEEPFISGQKGSGTVFFTGCNLQCIFCQNEKISRGKFGKLITVDELKEIYKELINKGAHNINLVTGTHFIDAISKSLDEKLPVPVVYNCGGYEEIDALKKLEGKIDIYLPDLKYSDNLLAKRYSNAPDYFEKATAAIKEMYRQVGSPVFNDNGIEGLEMDFFNADAAILADGHIAADRILREPGLCAHGQLAVLLFIGGDQIARVIVFLI